ncbi:MAG: hypothetical protein HYU52_09255 [Acidobacteria bacterium]|nr:hypothetical protein [Acidobacteriota bacterium]
MPPVEIHLALNHVPVVGFAGALAILVWGVLRRDEEVQRVGLAACVAVALLTIPVYFTGEPAEDVAEQLPGVTHDVIENHEEAAKYAFISSSLCGAVALLGMIVWRSPERRAFALRATLVLCVATTAMIGRTAMLGGQIRHTEVRAGAAVNAPAELERDAKQTRD